MLTRLFSPVLLLLLVACSPFRPAQTTPPKLPDTYLQQSTQKTLSLPNRWWEAFDDPLLNQLQQEMLAGNLDLRQALYRLEQLDALQKISGAGLWPVLNFEASTSRNRSPAVTGSSISNSSRISLAAGYEVDLWNRLHDRQTAAALRRRAGGKEVQTLLLSLTAQLAEQYFLAVEQRAQLQLGQRQVARYRQLLDTTTERYRAGLATAGEIYPIRKALAQSEARLPLYRTSLNQAENRIALLLGRFPQDRMARVAQLPQLSSMIDVGLPASLLARRPDISAALLQLQATNHELAAALAERLPAVNLTASLGRSTTRLATGNLAGSLWSLALGLTQPLFDGGRRQAESDRQKAVREEQLAAYRLTLLKAVQEVETALAADQNSADRLARLEQQQQAGERELNLARDNYRSGLINSSALLNSEINQLEILSQNLSARRQWLSRRITLARALGGNWMAGELSRQQQALSQKQAE